MIQNDQTKFIDAKYEEKQRKKLYGQQLKKQITSKHRLQKQKIINQSITYRENLENYIKNSQKERERMIQIKTEREKKIYQQNFKNARKLHNSITYQKTNTLTDQYTNPFDNLIQNNIERKNKLKQKINAQKQLNQMQKSLKFQTQQQKRQQNLEAQLNHLSQLETIQENRNRNKQFLVRKHRQNMSVFSKLQDLKMNQEQHLNQIQQKIINSPNLQDKILDRSSLNKHKKIVENDWKNAIQSQLEDRKREKDKEWQNNHTENTYQPIIEQSYRNKNFNYLKQLQRQIQEQKVRKNSQKIQRYQNVEIPLDSHSPAIIGQIPYSYQRKKQLQLLDRKLGIQSNVLKRSGETLLAPQQQMEYKKIKQELNRSRQQNRSRRSSSIHQEQRNIQIPLILNQNKIKIQKPHFLQNNNQNKDSVISKQNMSSRGSQVEKKTMKSYDFILGREKVFVIEK